MDLGNAQKPDKLDSGPYQHKRLPPQLYNGRTAALMQLHALASLSRSLT